MPPKQKLKRKPNRLHSSAIRQRGPTAGFSWGGNPHTRYQQAVDAITCPYLFGNGWNYPQTPYIFDFGPHSKNETSCKEYDNAYARQTVFSGQCILYCAGPKRVGADLYCPQKGYGFLKADGLKAQKQPGPDDLREDFLEGEHPAPSRKSYLS